MAASTSDNEVQTNTVQAPIDRYGIDTPYRDYEVFQSHQLAAMHHLLAARRELSSALDEVWHDNDKRGLLHLILEQVTQHHDSVLVMYKQSLGL